MPSLRSDSGRNENSFLKAENLKLTGYECATKEIEVPIRWFLCLVFNAGFGAIEEKLALAGVAREGGGACELGAGFGDAV